MRRGTLDYHPCYLFAPSESNLQVGPTTFFTETNERAPDLRDDYGRSPNCTRIACSTPLTSDLNSLATRFERRDFLTVAS